MGPSTCAEPRRAASDDATLGCLRTRWSPQLRGRALVQDNQYAPPMFPNSASALPETQTPAPAIDRCAHARRGYYARGGITRVVAESRQGKLSLWDGPQRTLRGHVSD